MEDIFRKDEVGSGTKYRLDKTLVDKNIVKNTILISFLTLRLYIITGTLTEHRLFLLSVIAYNLVVAIKCHYK